MSSEPLLLYRFLPVPEKLEEAFNYDTSKSITELHNEDINKRNAKVIDLLLTENKLFLSKLSYFTDPYEGLYLTEFNKEKCLSIEEEENKGKESSERSEIIKEINQYSDDYFPYSAAMLNSKLGIYCFSGNLIHPYMWNIYANNHKGLCIEFETSFDKKDIKDLIFIHKSNKNYSNADVRLIRLNYGDELEKINFKDISHDMKEEDERTRKIYAGLCKKAESWQYEDEYRMIILDPTLKIQKEDYFVEISDLNSIKPNFLRIKKIIFGAAISPNNKEWIKNKFKQFKEKYRQAVLTNKYTVEIECLNNKPLLFRDKKCGKIYDLRFKLKA